MSRLNELIRELCPDGVEFKKLGVICEIKTGKGITKADAINGGHFPIISGGKYPMGYYNEWNRHANTVTISRVGAYAGFVSYIQEKFYLNDKCFSVIPLRQDIAPHFLFFVLKEFEEKIKDLQSEGGVPTINTKKVGNIEIPIPPLDVQNEIVRILDIFTSHTAELQTKLQAELQARKEQYEYYRNKLLTFEKDDKNVKWMKLGEIGTFIRGNGLQKKDFTETGFPCIHYGQIHTHYGTFADTTISHTSFVLAEKLRKASYGDLVIATTSEDVDGVCKACAWLGKNDVAVSGDAYIYKHNQNPKYISYLFQTKRFYEYKRKASVGAKVVRVSGDSMKNFIFPIPSISEQTRIVSILDKFEALVNDLTEGIPAEIAAVQEQYEYYRNKLLTFKQRA